MDLPLFIYEGFRQLSPKPSNKYYYIINDITENKKLFYYRLCLQILNAIILVELLLFNF